MMILLNLVHVVTKIMTWSKTKVQVITVSKYSGMSWGCYDQSGSSKYEGVDWMGIFDDNMCKQYFYNKTVKRFDKWAIWSFYKVFHFMFFGQYCFTVLLVGL